MDESHATLPVPTRTRRGEREAEQTYTKEAAQVSGLLSCTICFFPLGHRRRLRPRLPQAHLARQRPRIGFPLAAPPFCKACHCAQVFARSQQLGAGGGGASADEWPPTRKKGLPFGQALLVYGVFGACI